MNAARKLLSQPDMTVVDVAAILRATATPEGQFDPNVVKLAQENERLQWEIQGWRGRCEMAREERDDLAGRYWRLQMTAVKGGQV